MRELQTKYQVQQYIKGSSGIKYQAARIKGRKENGNESMKDVPVG